MMQTVFFEMFLNVAHYNGSSFRKYSLCKLSTAVQTSTNMQYCITLQFQIWSLFRIHTHPCIHQSGLQKGFVTFSKRTDIYKRKQMQKGKIQRKVGIVRWRERERGGGGGGGRAETTESSSEGACEVIGESLHRDLAPVQIDLAAACTDSGKLSRKCKYPP